MHVLEHLRLGRRRVTTKQDVDVSTVLWRSTLFEALVRATKELEQDTLLHVFHLVDRGCKRAREKLVHVWPCSSLADLGFFFLADLTSFLNAARDLLRKLLLDRSRVNTHAALVDFLNVQTVDVSLEDVLDRSLSGVHAHLVALEDTRDLHPVAGLAHVDQLVVGAK